MFSANSDISKESDLLILISADSDFFFPKEYKWQRVQTFVCS